MKPVLRLLLLLPLLALAAPGDDKFLAAREAFRVGETVRLAHMVESLQGNTLRPWAEYWQLVLRLNDDDTAQIEEFLTRNAGTYLAEKLRSDWLKALGKRADWITFENAYPLLQEPDTEVTCYAWQMRLARHDDHAVLNDARDLWFTSTELPASCAPLMDRLVAEKQLMVDDIWARIRALLDQSKYAEAQAATHYLPDGELPDTRTLERIAAKPARYLDRLPANFPQQRRARETALFALLRQARHDTADAVQRWRKIEHSFDAADDGYVWGQLARQAARSHMSEALQWYELAGTAPLSTDQLAWRVRAALRASDWPAVLQAIDNMPGAMAAQPDWVYWRARALAATGHSDKAAGLYRNICTQPGFYGVLAAEELGLALALPPRAAATTTEELTQVMNNPGLRQALELFRLDMRVEGVREWNWTVRNMSDRELLAAAELARRNDVFDRVISTADKTLTEHDYTLRYLAPFRDLVSPKAQALALDDSWIYGLMRQESRFVLDARSGVGAKGLMQVMPATAKMVARKIGMSHYHAGSMNDMDTNVTLGTHYLKMVLDSLDNYPLLACTAYNAGPGRAQRWRGDRPLEGAIYAETIPLAETRDYVKKVMANSVYYSVLFEEKSQTLKSRLGVIPPRAGGSEASVDTDVAP